MRAKSNSYCLGPFYFFSIFLSAFTFPDLPTISLSFSLNCFFFPFWILASSAVARFLRQSNNLYLGSEGPRDVEESEPKELAIAAN